jgi:hypothetical protein
VPYISTRRRASSIWSLPARAWPSSTYTAPTFFFLNRDGCKHPTRAALNIAGELQQDHREIKELQPSPNKLQRGPWNEKANTIQSNVHLQIDAGSNDGLQLRRRGCTTWRAGRGRSVEESRRLLNLHIDRRQWSIDYLHSS